MKKSKKVRKKSGNLIYNQAMNKYLLKSSFSSACLLFLALFLIIMNISCSKKDDNSISEKATLTFKIDGIKDASTVFNSQASLNNMIGLKVNNYLYKETINKDDYSFDIISEQSNIGQDQGIYSSDKLSKIANTSIMGNDVHYRLIVLTLTDELVASVDVKVGQTQHISVTPGNSYKWLAYSYNSTTPIPNVDMNNPVIETPTTETLLYANGNTGVINNDGYIIPIVFSHQLTQLEVRVGITDKDPFRTINQVTGEFIGDVVKKCNFNVITGQKSSTLIPVNVGPLTFTQLTTGSDRTLVAKSYYTADESYTTYSVKINSLQIQNTSTTPLNLTQSLPTPSEGVQGQVNFSGFSSSNSGSILIGRLDLTVNQTIPPMTLIAWSNNVGIGYKLDPNTASGNFIRSTANFGPSSIYVKIENLTVASQPYVNTAEVGVLLSNPADYPDILVIANSAGYLDQNSWNAVIRYLNAGGNVFYTQDANDNLAMTNISTIFGGTVTNTFVSEDAGVYKFTDTPEGAADISILNGPFGDVRDLYWGQDRSGTPYVSYSGSNRIAYSIRSQNFNSNTGVTNGSNFFRHKTKSFFYAGDGGFNANTNLSGPANWGAYPFRTTGASSYLPTMNLYGRAPASTSLTYYPPHLGAGQGTYPIANSMVFGNIISWMLRRAHFMPVDRIN